MTKNELRRLAKERLAALTDKEQRSCVIRQKMATFLKPNVALMTYISFANEVATNIAEYLLEMPCRFLAVPLIRGNDIIPIRLESMNELAAGQYGILEPLPSIADSPLRQVSTTDIDVVFVPGLAFDRSGNRLGRGKGYYDRFLRQLKPEAVKIGLAFECQIFDKIPTDSNDVQLDGIVTE
ncbi:hypothetical protein FACS1894170_03630 [Planctomycetales bacterium]|nr:hypothetical protein FACS1894170_03630 [Planctomycetales bacterium]